MKAPIHPNAGLTGVMIALLASTVCRAAGSVVYCDARAPGDNNGSDWANACLCLQDAIKNRRDPAVEIRVAQGTYNPDQYYAIRRDGDRVVASGKRTESFVLPSGVTLKGGYAGYGAVNPNQRNIDAYASILSGDLAGNDVALQGHDWQSLSDFVQDKSRTDNSQSVVMVSGGAPVLDGFTITGGHAGVLSNIHGARGSRPPRCRTWTAPAPSSREAVPDSSAARSDSTQLAQARRAPPGGPASFV